jgi:hypothetical protein
MQKSGVDTATSQGSVDVGELRWFSQSSRTLGCRRLDLFAGLCLCVVDFDPQHGETLLQLLRPALAPSLVWNSVFIRPSTSRA